eukprot:1339161-Amorphochlora_amoeboformis.AAC.1
MDDSHWKPLRSHDKPDQQRPWPDTIQTHVTCDSAGWKKNMSELGHFDTCPYNLPVRHDPRQSVDAWPRKPIG